MRKISIFVVILLVTSCKLQKDEATGEYKTVLTSDPVAGAVNEVNNQSLRMQEKLAEMSEAARVRAEVARQEAWNKELTKIWVRAKDTKTCMRLLKTDVINQEVIDCNKDRFVSVRNDEVEQFKKDNDI